MLSGGIDSATLAAVLLARATWQPTALFIDFGQRAAAAERESSHLIARHYGIAWAERRLAGGPALPLTEVDGRNDMLIAVAATVPADAVAIGTHAGTPYADSSPAHADAWQRLLDLQHHGRKRLVAPFLRLTKHDVVALARDCGVPLTLTRSCDDAGSPCGECTSCLDRGHALAGA